MQSALSQFCSYSHTERERVSELFLMQNQSETIRTLIDVDSWFSLYTIDNIANKILLKWYSW